MSPQPTSNNGIPAATYVVKFPKSILAVPPDF